MKLFFFTKLEDCYATGRLIEESEKRGHEASKMLYRFISVKIEDGRVQVYFQGKRIDIPDAAYFRLSGAGAQEERYIYQRLPLLRSFPQEVYLVNKTTYIRWPRLGKLEQHYYMAEAGLPLVPTWSYARSEAVDWKDFTEYPVIAKTMYGSLGRGVFKLNSKEEVWSLGCRLNFYNLIFQKFLPTGEDYRVIVIGGKALPKAMKKTAVEGNYLTNVAQGGKIEGIELTDELREIAEKAAGIFKTDYAGVDIMYDALGEPYVLEVNRAAQFKGFEESTGINVAAEIVDLIESKALPDTR